MPDAAWTAAWALIGGLVGGLVLAPLLIRSADWLVDHEPKWYRWWMGWIGGKHGPVRAEAPAETGASLPPTEANGGS